MGVNSKNELFITKDELIESYAWLLEQPDDVRNCASSIDSVVSLYREAKRKSTKNGSLANDPKSNRADKKTFNESLKRLSKAIDDLETSDETNLRLDPSLAKNDPTVNTSNSARTLSDRDPPPSTGPTDQPFSAHSKGAPDTCQEPAYLPDSCPCALFTRSLIDETSHQRIVRLKDKFNLSCEQEVMRLAITVAYHKLKRLT